MVILLILAAWFTVSILVAPLAGRWLRACREAAEAQWDALDSGDEERDAA